MGRRTDQAELRERIGRLREEILDICLRTTLISGFPGETQEDHIELYNFVDELEFDRLGVFTYSQEGRDAGGADGESGPPGSEGGQTGRADGAAAGKSPLRRRRT